MARTEQMKNALVQPYVDLVAKVSLHNGAPGLTGANDLGLGHLAVTWPDPPVGGEVTSDQITFTCPAGTVMTHVGLWDSSDVYLDSILHNLTFITDTDFKFRLHYVHLDSGRLF